MALVGGEFRGIRAGGAVAARLHGAALVVDVVLEFLAEHFHERARGHRRGISQRADGAALDVVGEVEQEVEVLAPPGAVLDAVEYPVEPARAFAARRALPAGFL